MLNNIILLLTLSLLISSLLSGQVQAGEYLLSGEKDTPQHLDFGPVTALLDAVVLDMGLSKRIHAQKPPHQLGTHFTQIIQPATHNEGNRIAYELLSQPDYLDKLVLIKTYLEQLADKRSLAALDKNEQQAYWLNLYNISLINEIALAYPIANLHRFLHDQGGILNQPLVRVSGKAISLNQIARQILPSLSDDPLLIYGLYQGVVGGPSVRKQAYIGNVLYRQLRANAYEFIHSNRGTRLEGRTLRVSDYYRLNRHWFSDYQTPLREHLLTFAGPELAVQIREAGPIRADISNWRVTDLFGTVRTYGNASPTSIAALMDSGLNKHGMLNNFTRQVGKLSLQQTARLRELMRTRAINFGGGSVTVTDIEENTDTID